MNITKYNREILMMKFVVRERCSKIVEFELLEYRVKKERGGNASGSAILTQDRIHLRNVARKP